MQRMTLEEFAAKYGQSKAAEILGMRQGSLSKAIHSGREIYVSKKDGKYIAYETKPFPTTKTRDSS